MKGSNSIDRVSDSDIALIGMACRFPGAVSTAAFWQNLCNGIESIALFSEQELAASGVGPALWNKPNYVRATGVLSDIDLFDAFFFDYSPHEAEITDPQHRLFLECAWQAVENAGYNPEIYKKLIGVYAGTGMNTYLHNNLWSDRVMLEPGSGYQTMIASDKDFLATKVSYKLNLKGPSVTVQTACSTSLVAVHLACQSLINGDCDMALAGGVSVRIPHNVGYLYQEGMILSPDGHCRAFDAQAQGTIIGNGVGVVVLKMAAEAVHDGDRIYAVIKGSAINNDGSLKAGYTAPSLEAQAAVISEAQGIAGVAAESITYIETHGTGTPLGDPIEIAALTKAFQVSTDKKRFCAIGSVKTNIGHLDAAAGIAGLIKTTLALQHQQLPPSLHFEKPNPRIDFDNSPFYVNTNLLEWKADTLPRRAGISSFGIGGTNAHVILEEAPEPEPREEARPWQLLLLSAKTRSALDAATHNLVEYMSQQPDSRLADIAYTLQVGRKVFSHRRAVVCQDRAQAMAALNELDARVLSTIQESTERPVAFMFTGQGAQYVDMAVELYETEQTFQAQVDRCSELLKPYWGLDLRDILYPAEEQAEAAAEQLKQTAIAQPALFVIEYALASLWQEWGISPQVMIGHSIGEYVAACLASVFSLEDALTLVANRGRLMQSLPRGSMLSVPLSEQALRPMLHTNLSLAAVNGPSRCVISGTLGAVEALEARLIKQGVRCSRLQTSHAFHSAMMDPILESFAETVGQIALNPPTIPYLSNVTGDWIKTEEATDPDYWARHLRQTVRFADGLQLLLKEPAQILLEVGPGRTLSTLAMQHPDRLADQVVTSSLHHPHEPQSDVAFLLNTLGKLWLAGTWVNWSGFHAHYVRQRQPLPTYPFERQRYWVNAQVRTEAQAAARPEGSGSAKKVDDRSNWFYVPSWKRSIIPHTLPGGQLLPAHWLIFADECGLGIALANRLKHEDRTVTVVRAGSAFARPNVDEYILNPGCAGDYETLLDELRLQNKFPQAMAHLWSVTRSDQLSLDCQDPDQLQARGFYSLLFLTQALGKQNTSAELCITVVSNNLQEVTGQDVVCPAKATLLGPVAIIPHEYANLHCRSLDVELSLSGDGFDADTLKVLVAELGVLSSEASVAYRGNRRWVQIFEPVHLDQLRGVTSRLRQGGVYLITGGLGGLGLTLARHLAETVQAKLILTGRSALPASKEWEHWLATHEEREGTSRKIRAVQELQNLGAEVWPIQADVTQLEEMQAVIRQALARYGQINGVIHAAGIPAGGLIQLKTREMVESSLAPKVKGTLVLETVCQNLSLDFLVLCSSIDSVVGRIGQVDYYAANAFLDAFAYDYQTRQGVPTICINWDTWQEVGMAAEAARQLSKLSEQPLLEATKAVHPLLGQLLTRSQDREEYVARYRVPDHWVLHEHGLMGKATVPGTAYLEMARAALECQGSEGWIEIRDAYFLTPLILENDEVRQVYTILRKEETGFEFFVMSHLDSAADTWQGHARGKLSVLQPEPLRKWNLEDIKTRCDQAEVAHPLERAQLGNFDLQRRTIARGKTAEGQSCEIPSTIISARKGEVQMEFGPRWTSLQWVKLGTDEGLALLELSPEFEVDIQAYKLHPALLDQAVAFSRLFRSQGSYLPLSYKKLIVKGPLPKRIYSYARSRDSSSQAATLCFDVTLLDEAGTELVEIEEFVAMRVSAANPLTPPSRSYSLPVTPSLGSRTSGPALHVALFQKDLEEGLLPAEGVDVFERILESALSRVIVSTRDLSTRIEENRARNALLLSQTPSAAAGRSSRHPRPEVMTAYAAPRTEMEQKLADIWQQVLGIEVVGVHDNFNELGGDSLLFTQIHSQIRQSLQPDLSIATLLEYPTIANLAHFIHEQATADPAAFQEVHDRADKRKEAKKRHKQTAVRKPGLVT